MTDEQTITIATANGRVAVACYERRAGLAITATDREDRRPYAITHIESGLAVGHYVRLEAASSALSRLLTLEVDWTQSAEALTRPEIGSRVLPILAASDGLGWEDDLDDDDDLDAVYKPVEDFTFEEYEALIDELLDELVTSALAKILRRVRYAEGRWHRRVRLPAWLEAAHAWVHRHRCEEA